MFLSDKFVFFSVIILIVVSSVPATPTPTPENNESSNSNNTKAAAAAAAAGSGGAAAAAAADTTCFSSDTLVTLANQQQIPIGRLRSGHQILTINGLTIVPTEMIMMMDQNQLSLAMFYTLSTASGHRVSVSGLHLMIVVTNNGKIEYKAAKDIQLGDILRVVSNGQIYSSSVINVITEMKTGFYAPLTTTGTLLVNNVSASCFANVKSHDMIQLCMTPWRWYYQISRLLSVEKPFGDESVDGIHYLPKMFYEIIQTIYPSILRLS